MKGCINLSCNLWIAGILIFIFMMGLMIGALTTFAEPIWFVTYEVANTFEGTPTPADFPARPIQRTDPDGEALGPLFPAQGGELYDVPIEEGPDEQGDVCPEQLIYREEAR